MREEFGVFTDASGMIVGPREVFAYKLKEKYSCLDIDLSVRQYIAAHPKDFDRIGGFGDDAISLKDMLDWALKQQA